MVLLYYIRNPYTRCFFDNLAVRNFAHTCRGEQNGFSVYHKSKCAIKLCFAICTLNNETILKRYFNDGEVFFTEWFFSRIN